MPPASALRDLGTWRGLTTLDREKIRDALAAALGSDFSPGDLVGTHELPEVVHESGVRFVAIPGGDFEMGMRDLDLARVASIPWDDGMSFVTVRDTLTARARPVRMVTVAPFLCARSPVRDDDGGLRFLESEEALELLAEAGFRALSEAEWEYVARNGGVTAFVGTDNPGEADALVFAATDREDNPTSTRSDETAFGVGGLHWGEYVADGWHPTYDGAPSDARAWEPSDELTTWRGGAAQGYPFQLNWGIVECLAAFRREPTAHDPLCLRFARDLPG